jgi:hypothetical protein
MIKKILQDPAILLKNIYNINKTGVMLYIFGSVKILVNKDDLRDYKDAAVKHTIVTTIECINTNSRSLLLIII